MKHTILVRVSLGLIPQVFAECRSSAALLSCGGRAPAARFLPLLKRPPCTLLQSACARAVLHVCKDLNQKMTHQDILLRTDKQPAEKSGFQVIPVNRIFPEPSAHVSPNVIVFICHANKMPVLL